MRGGAGVIMFNFLNAHQHWIKENCSSDFSDNIEEFFEIEADEIFGDVDKMHYLDNEKISAIEFMKTNPIENDVLFDIKETINRFEVLVYTSKGKDLVLKIIEFLDDFVIFEYVPEFRDIGYNLESLKSKLILLNVEYLDEAQIQILEKFIVAIFEDLDKWFNEILIYQTAQDIHYLDASLLASVSQLDLIIDSFKFDNKDSENMEFF